MTVAFSILAVLAVVHGGLIALGTHRAKWASLIVWYRLSTQISLLVLILCVGAAFLIVATPAANPFKIPLGEDLVQFANHHRLVIGQIVIAFAVTLIVVLAELFWIDPLEKSHSRPVMIWLAWFFISFFFSLWLAGVGAKVFDNYLNQFDGRASEIAAAARAPQPDGEPSAGADSSDQPITAVATEPRPPPIEAVKVFSLVLLTITGLLYYGWTTGLLFRRITDLDRLIGRPAVRLAFAPKVPRTHAFHPAQSVFVGPSLSGKTELIRWIQGLTPKHIGPTASTVESTLLRLKGNEGDDWYDVSVVDTGGELMGDQLDLIRNVRTDCLVVVICAAHLIDDSNKLSDVANWNLSEVHKLVKPLHNQGTSAAFFQTLYFATNRAGSVTKSPPSTPSTATQPLARATPSPAPQAPPSTPSPATQPLAPAYPAPAAQAPAPGRKRRSSDAVAKVYTVLVVLKDRDAQENLGSQFATVPLHCLEKLASDIFRRFSLNEGDAARSSAAIKLTITDPQSESNQAAAYRIVTVQSQSGVLSSENGAFRGWPYTLSGVWGAQ